MESQHTRVYMQPRIQRAYVWVPEEVRHMVYLLTTGRGQYYNAASVSFPDAVRLQTQQTRAYVHPQQTNRYLVQPQQYRNFVWVSAEVRHLVNTLLEGNQSPEEAGTNDVTQYEGIPTAKHVLDSLPNSVVLPSDDGAADCGICMDCMCEDDEDNTITKLPCGHIFHRDCIVLWLCNHNTCPFCHFELPADSTS